jgi:hypothetical protein
VSQVNPHEQQIEASMNALFRRLPALCGFTVQGSGGLFVGEVTVNPLAGWHGFGEVTNEIAATLGELIAQCPEASELLNERTFARVFH